MKKSTVNCCTCRLALSVSPQGKDLPSKSNGLYETKTLVRTLNILFSIPALISIIILVPYRIFNRSWIWLGEWNVFSFDCEFLRFDTRVQSYNFVPSERDSGVDLREWQVVYDVYCPVSRYKRLTKVPKDLREIRDVTKRLDVLPSLTQFTQYRPVISMKLLIQRPLFPLSKRLILRRHRILRKGVTQKYDPERENMS